MTVVNFNKSKGRIWIKSKKKKFKNSYYIDAIFILVFILVFGIVTKALNLKVIYAIVILLVAAILNKIIVYMKEKDNT